MSIREDLRAVERIQDKLQEARDIATEAGFDPDPNSKEASNPFRLYPGSITPLVEVAIAQCENVKKTLASDGG